MRRLLLSPIVAVFCLTPIGASEPGQPLGDCDDWVILRPGITCTEVVRYPCGPDQCQGNTIAFDNQGGYFYGDRTPGMFHVGRFDPASPDDPEVIIEISERTYEIPPGDWVTDRFFSPPKVGFDELGGSLYVAVQPYCDDPLGAPCSYGTGWRLLRFDSFPTRFEILQTYDPDTSSWSFAVPARPEGLDGADHFDTYYGTLTMPIDFSAAQPLECGYPASPPGAGEQLTVPDPLPDPPSGTGRYYLTVVNYGDSRRSGRKQSGGELSGRNPDVLPVCN